MPLALKLLLTSVLIAAVSLAGKRWGPAVSGMLTGLPLTSGPISVFLAVQYGSDFAAHSASGNLAGQASVCVFCLAYSLAARRMSWLASSAVGILAFLAATALWNQFSLSLLTAFLLLIAVILTTLRLLPRDQVAFLPVQLPAWDLPARLLAAALFVYLLTTFANRLGEQLSGLLSPFPVFGVVLAAFTHAQQGAPAARRLLRGIVAGSTGYTAFFLVTGLLLPHASLVLTYLLAALAALAMNSAVLYFSHKR